MRRALPPGAQSARLCGSICVWVVVLLLAACWPNAASAQLLSPGELSRDHHELDGDEQCNRCHASGRRTSTNQCLSCHEDLAASIAARRGLHGREWRGKDCGQCHVEHLGRNTRLIRWPADGPDGFDHGRTGYELEGRHRKTACRDCHDKRNEWGSPTYLKLEQRCNGCHEDEHEGRFSQRCETCHDASGWESLDLEGFDHDLARFELRGEHVRTECDACHDEPPTYKPLAFDTCASCHDDPHEGELGSACSSCHVESGWRALGKVRRRHRWLSLKNGHQDVGCRGCHDRGLDAAPAAGGACVSCHEPVHEAPLGRNCASCHRDVKWLGLPPAIGRRAHAKTAFDLSGAHVAATCDSCHEPHLPAQQRYRELGFERCADCHSDPHQNSWHAAPLQQMDCDDCHTDTRFVPTTFGPSAHGQTAFPLQGRHGSTPCGACHDSPRPRLHFGQSDQACADCHDNPHGDQFRAEMAQNGCATCHGEVGWNNPRIDHSIWPLTGAHASAACDGCHTPTDADRRAGRGASFRGVPRACEGCHGQTHAGQFQISAPQRACVSCHTTEAFQIEPFDHDGLAGYALEGAHAQAACADCHPSVELPEWGPVVRYRLGYSECEQCHANPHGGAP